MSEETGVVTPPAEATPPNVAPSPAETAPVETPKVTPERTFTQAELNDAIEKRVAREQRKHERERGQLLDRLTGQKPHQQAEQPKRSDDGPKREDFDDYEQYIEARSEYVADKKIAEREAKREQEARQKSWTQRVKEAAKEIPDIEDILRNSDAPLTPAMSDAIMDSDIGPKLAHYLDQNPDEAQRIADLKPVAQVKELTKLEDKLKAPPSPKPASNAPEPITPVGQKASAASDEPSDKDDINAWMKKREKQVRNR